MELNHRKGKQFYFAWLIFRFPFWQEWEESAAPKCLQGNIWAFLLCLLNWHQKHRLSLAGKGGYAFSQATFDNEFYFSLTLTSLCEAANIDFSSANLNLMLLDYVQTLFWKIKVRARQHFTSSKEIIKKDFSTHNLRPFL